MAAIELADVKKSYGRNQVVHGVDASIEAGEFVVILGPSGCGKSTLLRMIAGLEETTGGTIRIGGRVVNDLEPRERGCAMVFQNYALYPHMSVADNIGYALKVAGVPRPERLEKVRAVALSVEIEGLLDRKPSQLSGGQRQRVAMARAMVREPQVFLFDEPFSNLDAKLRVAMRAEVRRLHRALGVTSVFVTHDQTEAMTLADRLIIMNAGRVEQMGTPAEVYGAPATRFVADFIGQPPMNLLEGRFDADGRFLHGRDGALELSALNGLRQPGHRLVIGLRPEHLRRAPGSGPGTIAATVDYVEDLGSSRLVHADASGSRLVVVESGATPPAPGTALHFELADSLHLFSAEDGRRLNH